MTNRATRDNATEKNPRWFAGIRRWLEYTFCEMTMDIDDNVSNENAPEPELCSLCDKPINDHEDQCPVEIFFRMHERWPMASSVELARAALDEAAQERERCRVCKKPFLPNDLKEDGAHTTCVIREKATRAK